jgi:hypothetical protein
VWLRSKLLTAKVWLTRGLRLYIGVGGVEYSEEVVVNDEHRDSAETSELRLASISKGDRGVRCLMDGSIGGDIRDMSFEFVR